MKVKANSILFKTLDKPNDVEIGGQILPYIRKFLTIHPYAGKYIVNDEQYVSSVDDVRNKHFHPSGDCLKCPRLLYWERQPEAAAAMEETPTPELQAIFKMGDAVHAMIQAWFMAMNELDGFPRCIGNEQRIDDKDWNIGGFIDSVLEFPGIEGEVPIEIKSINDYSFGRLSEPLAAHKLQVGCYIMEKDAPFGIVLYYDKNTSAMKEFRVEPFDMMPTLMKWSKVRIAVQNGDPSNLDHGCKVGSKEWEKCPARRWCK